MSVIILLVLVAIMLISGMPIAAAFGLSSLIYLAVSPTLPDLLFAKTAVEGIDSFTLLAIPFFILAGNIMSASGITRHIFQFARAAVGHLPGGLGHVNVFSSLIFAGMSGSAVADAGGLGAVQAREMQRHGYDQRFAAGITATSSTIGPIIPPSIPLLVYAVIASVSVRDLFLAGIVPGILMAMSLIGATLWLAVRRNYPVDDKFDARKVVRTGIVALPALLTPLLLVGGITLGIVTPTESATIVIAYALLTSVLIYREMGLKQFLVILRDSAETTATVMVILASAAIFAWILASEGVPQAATRFLLDWTSDPVLLMLIVVALLLVVGTFLEAGAAMVIIVPILLPVTDMVGIDRVHLGIVVVFTLMLGLITPPVGLVLFVLSKAADIPVSVVIRGTLPLMVPLVILGILIAVVPEISMFLVHLF